MHKVLVHNVGLAAAVAGADPTAAATGTIYGFDETDRVILNTAANVFLQGPLISFHSKRADGYIDRSQLMDTSKIALITKKVYAANDAAVLTFTVATAASAAGVVSFKVMNSASRTTPFPRWSVSVSVASGDTASTIAGKARAAFTALKNTDFTVGGAAATCVLTSKVASADYKFTGAFSEESGSLTADSTGVTATHVETLGGDKGTSLTRLRELELSGDTNGVYYQESGLLGRSAVRSTALTATNYTVYAVQYEAPYEQAINKNYKHITLYLAYNTAVATDLTTRMDVLFGDFL